MRKLLLLLLVLALLAGTVAAAEIGETQADQFGTDALEEGLDSDTEELLKDYSPRSEGDFSQGALDIFKNAVNDNKSTFLQAVEMAAVVLAVVLLCGMVSGFGETNAVSPVSIVGALGITAACAFECSALIRLGAETVQKISDYAVLLLPALASATVATGAVGTAGAVYAGTVLFTDILIVLINKLLVPMVYVYIGVCTAGAALDNHLLDSIRDFISWLISGSLKAILYLYTGYITISGIISGASDAASLKATKLALGGMIPVVGGILSDASESVVASASILKNAIGIYGMLAVLAFCAAPFLKIAIHYLMLKGTKAAAGTIGRKNHVELIGNLSTAMGFLLGMTGTCALMLLLSGVCSLKAVTA